MSSSFHRQEKPQRKSLRKRASDEQWVKEHLPLERKTKKHTSAADAVDAVPITSGRSDVLPADLE
jgi:hypothetical protein